MIIGVPREIKIEEFRVGLTPVGAQELARRRPYRPGGVGRRSR